MTQTAYYKHIDLIKILEGRPDWSDLHTENNQMWLTNLTRYRVKSFLDKELSQPKHGLNPFGIVTEEYHIDNITAKHTARNYRNIRGQLEPAPIGTVEISAQFPLSPETTRRVDDLANRVTKIILQTQA
jgi:hypothetical protein